MSENKSLRCAGDNAADCLCKSKRDGTARCDLRQKAVEIVKKLDYDFSLADKDTAMSSGVIARTIVLNRRDSGKGTACTGNHRGIYYVSDRK